MAQRGPASQPPASAHHNPPCLYLPARLRADARKAQERAIQLANDRIEKISAESRATIRDMASMLMSTMGRNHTDTVLPALTWLELIAGSNVIDSPTKTILVDHRIAVLTGALDLLNAEGLPNSVEAGLTRYALAYSKLNAGQYEGVAELLDQNDEFLLRHLDARDPLRLAFAAMRQCAQATGCTGPDLEPALAELNKTAIELRKNGHADPVCRLIVRVSRRLREKEVGIAAP